MIDWSLAGSVGRLVAGTPPPAAPLALAGPAAESERVAGAYTRLVAPHVPVAEAVDRGAWIDANLRSMRSVLEPLEAKLGASGLGILAGPLRAVMGSLLAAEVGALSGLMAQRVLGQFEFPLLDPGAPARLLYVAPNLSSAAGQLEADPDELLRWVALHETTHALQFGGVEWLRGYLASIIRSLLDSVELDPRALLRLPGAGDVRELVDRVRTSGMVALVATAEQRAHLDRAQAVMSVLEGHAEHVMDAAGAEVLPGVDRLRAGLEARRASRPPAWRVLEKLLGLDMKMRQYAQGKAFCDAVVAEGGIEGLNRVWEGPENLPSLTEIEAPLAWAARVGM